MSLIHHSTWCLLLHLQTQLSLCYNNKSVHLSDVRPYLAYRIKHHHKSLFCRFQKPDRQYIRWVLSIMCMIKGGNILLHALFFFLFYQCLVVIKPQTNRNCYVLLLIFLLTIVITRSSKLLYRGEIRIRKHMTHRASNLELKTTSPGLKGAKRPSASKVQIWWISVFLCAFSHFLDQLFWSFIQKLITNILKNLSFIKVSYVFLH